MTMDDQRFDRALPALFVELASASTPAYLEAAIERASSRPQRPAWTYPGRWLPMQITTQAAPVARMPWRQIGIFALIGLLLAVAAVAYVGTRRDPSPAPPFGRAANGAIAMERQGDIVTVDPVTGAVTPISTGPEIDSAPVFFRDGLRIAFERRVDGPGDRRLIMVASADGSGLASVTREPLDGLVPWSISPDGRDVLVTRQHEGQLQMTVLAVDGTREPTTLDVPLSVDPSEEAPSYRPPDGREILVIGKPADALYHGVYVVNAETGAVLRALVEPLPDADVFGASWSPTGDTVRYLRFPIAGDGPRMRTHVVSADGTGDRMLVAAPGIADAAGADWSNDGTRLVVLRVSAGDGSDERVLVVPVQGNAPSVEIACDPSDGASCPAFPDSGNIAWTWSPDDQFLIGILIGEDGSARYFLADPVTGRITPTDWTGSGPPTWRRMAP